MENGLFEQFVARFVARSMVDVAGEVIEWVHGWVRESGTAEEDRNAGL